MAKLTDAQLIVLSKAAEREDGAAVLPDRINKAAPAKVAASLVVRKLMREVRARNGTPVWRLDEDGRCISLVITRAGRDAIGVADETSETQPPVEARTAKRLTVGTKTEPSSNAGLRPGSKQALLVAMLAKDKGATLTSLVEATGWLPHTTRAAITGLRKRGFAIERTRHEKLGSLYRIVGARTASVGA